MVAMLLWRWPPSRCSRPEQHLLKGQRPSSLGDRILQAPLAEQHDAAADGDPRFERTGAPETGQDRLRQAMPLAGRRERRASDLRYALASIAAASTATASWCDASAAITASSGSAGACFASTHVSNRCPSAYAASASSGR